jgi:hypothetical protein
MSVNQHQLAPNSASASNARPARPILTNVPIYAAIKTAAVSTIGNHSNDELMRRANETKPKYMKNAMLEKKAVTMRPIPHAHEKNALKPIHMTGGSMSPMDRSIPQIRSTTSIPTRKMKETKDCKRILLTGAITALPRKYD